MKERWERGETHQSIGIDWGVSAPRVSQIIGMRAKTPEENIALSKKLILDKAKELGLSDKVQRAIAKELGANRDP